MVRARVCVLVVIAIAATGCGGHSGEVKAAVATAESWLKLMDAGKPESAAMAEGALKDALFNDPQAVSRPRNTTLGSPTERKLVSAEYSDQPAAGSGQGEFVNIKYSTKYNQLSSGSETVTLVKDKDGWKVIGYQAD